MRTRFFSPVDAVHTAGVFICRAGIFIEIARIVRTRFEAPDCADRQAVAPFPIRRRRQKQDIVRRLCSSCRPP